jgi:Ca-activated chloride channel family protein
MGIINFANPSAFWMLILVILGITGAILYGQRLQNRLSRWIDRKFWPTLIPEFSSKVFFRKTLWLGLSLFFLVIALARPQWGEHEEMIRSEGMDILFLLDLSTSMNAEDTPPSRLNRAQTFIKKTLQNLADDRVGIVAFAGKAFLTVPLTTDFGYVAEVTDTLNPDAMVSQGTNIGAAIETGIKAFERSSEDDHKTSRAIILISDGEDFGPDATAAAKKLKDFGAGFFTLSVGTPEGAPIPLRNESGILQTYKKDRSEKPVLSRVNSELMAKLAESGGGTFIELVNPDDAAYTITKSLRSYGRDAKKEPRQVVKIDRYMYFVAASLFFLLLNLCTGYRKILILCLLFFPFSGSVQAQTLESYFQSKKGERQYLNKDYDNSAKSFEESRKNESENPSIQYDEATALAKGKHGEDAIFNFGEATKKALSQGDYETAAKSLYNEGITQVEQKNLKEAYDRLTKAIELAKVSEQPEIEKKAREALMSMIQKQKDKNKQDQENKDQKQDPKDQKDQNKSGGSGQENKDQKDKKDQNKKDQDKKDQGQKKDQKKDPQQTEDGKKREFKSGTLSKDVAESIMNDLSDREKQLFQHRMKERKTREMPNDKDW